MSRCAVGQLLPMWRRASGRLDERTAGMTDDEYFWEPTPGCWTVHRVTGGGEWTIDYEWPPPTPPPMTTIAWRMVHVANGNTIYYEHAFGPGVRMFTDLDPPSTASGARDYVRSSCAAIEAWLASAVDDDLSEQRPSHLGDPRTAGEVMQVLLDELVHHGAEIALLRDLYLRREA